ncbi:MAG: YebC/PmpR family DNA-binding transcriptional regulator [Deltaproteobacteria bacterium]|nr:YebC/PmpR family DNA-binding transcriptional regulator [Deltaproteobacteria bacterium]
MAGHSKWKNIQHRKGAQDAKRGKIFTKIGIEITVAARAGGGNPEDNPRLRAALAKAKAANMPKDNYTRAIKKGTGEAGGANYTEKLYEGYGPGGVAMLVECLTDNINRTVSEVRFAFSKYGGNLGTDGSVAWMFHRKGMLVYEKNQISDGDQFFELALEHGAEDVREDGDQYEIICQPEDFMALKSALDELCPDPAFCEITMIPENPNTVEAGKAESLEKLINALEDNDDVQNVYHNGDFPEVNS